MVLCVVCEVYSEWKPLNGEVLSFIGGISPIARRPVTHSAFQRSKDPCKRMSVFNNNHHVRFTVHSPSSSLFLTSDHFKKTLDHPILVCLTSTLVLLVATCAEPGSGEKEVSHLSNFISDTTRISPYLDELQILHMSFQPKSYKSLMGAYVNRFPFLSLSILISPFLIRS